MVKNDVIMFKNSQSILKDRHLGCHPLSWTSPLKGKLQRLINNRKVLSQCKLDYKIYKHQTTIGHQVKNLGINNYNRDISNRGIFKPNIPPSKSVAVKKIYQRVLTTTDPTICTQTSQHL